MATTSRARIGEDINHRSPNWAPLRDFLLLDLVDDFMWMGEYELRDRTRIHAYKHHATRRYLYLDLDAGTWEYAGSGKYRKVSPYVAVWRAFAWWLYPDPEHADAHEKPNWKQRAALKALVAHIFGEDEPESGAAEETWDDEDPYADSGFELPTDLGPDT